jgi:hypothetical protein
MKLLYSIIYFLFFLLILGFLILNLSKGQTSKVNVNFRFLINSISNHKIDVNNCKMIFLQGDKKIEYFTVRDKLQVLDRTLNFIKDFSEKSEIQGVEIQRRTKTKRFLFFIQYESKLFMRINFDVSEREIVTLNELRINSNFQ